MSEWSRKILALWRELLVQQWDGRPSGRGGIGGGGGKGGWAEDWRRLWLRYQKTYYIREPRGTCRLMAHMRHGRFWCECSRFSGIFCYSHRYRYYNNAKTDDEAARGPGCTL